MRISTRSCRIRRALRAVLSRIPAADRRRVETFIWWIRADHGWRLGGLGSYIVQESAGLYPLFSIHDSPQDLTVRPGAQIVYQLSVCNLFSDKALIGITAHELAHAYQAAGVRGDWHARMQRRYAAGERDADRQAIAWGFRHELRACREERQRIVIPFFAAHEERIFRTVWKRDHKQDEKNRERLRQLMDAKGRTQEVAEARHDA